MQPFTMVVGVDLSEYADAVLQRALDQALRHDAATIRVVTVISRRSDEAKARDQLIERIQQAIDDTVPADRRVHLSLFAHVRCGSAAQEIVDLAEESMADLVVVGRFGEHRGPDASVADPIVAGAGCPVLVVPPPRDLSASSRQCTDCVDVRRETGGEQWFCARHHTEHLGWSIAAVGAGINEARPIW